MKTRSKPPHDAVVAVTHRCNARCVMCNIWKGDTPDRLMPEHMRKLPSGLRTINLSGGEPFLRDDLADFVRAAHEQCPQAIITISTNAFLPDRIAEQMPRLLEIDPGLHLAISLDGLGAAHDRIRGVPGVFERAKGLIERLTADGYRGLRLSMTLSNENLDQLTDVAQLAERLGLELGVVAAHGAGTHLGIGSDDVAVDRVPAWLGGAFEKVIAPRLRSWRAKNWLRAHFTWGTYRYLAGRPWEIRCRAGRDMFFLQADGAVYSCSVRGQEMGNIVDEEFPEIWTGPRAIKAVEFVHRCPERCWMICTARPTYRAKWFSVCAWIIWKKLLAHLRMFHLPDLSSDASEDAA
ncbi:MAG: radical SAM protein [Phycisphaerales bacterium]|jgi:Fe-coproporphyrin III synthase|nr:radical SAM protein [Phycisphaerales bacterium]